MRAPPGGDSVLGKSLARWVGAAVAQAPAVLVAAVLVTAGSLYYAVEHLGINTNTDDMLAADLPFRQSYETFQQQFPQFRNTILVVVDAQTPEQSRQAAWQLAELLSEGAGFKSVYLPGINEFLDRHALLYLGLEELDRLADDLAAIQPFLGRLTRDQSLRGLVTMLASATEAATDGESIALEPLFRRLHATIAELAQGRPHVLSWEEMMRGGEASAAGRRQLIVVQPQLDFTSLLAAGSAMRAIREAIGSLHLDAAHGLRVRLTGAVALNYEELVSAGKGAGMAAVAALALVAMTLYVGLGSLRLVVAALITLMMGLILTAGFATIAVGQLNLISVAFAVLYIGLGVDFAIHLCLRYVELCRGGMRAEAALPVAAGDVGTSLVFCTLTTAAGFFCFVPTAYAGVSELGIISGTGMFISLLLTLTVLPALIRLWQPARQGIMRLPFAMAQGFGRSMLSFPIRHRRIVLAVAVALTLAALWLLRSVSFDYNPVNLRAADSESVTTFNELMADGDTRPSTITALYPDAGSARDAAGRLKRLDVVARAVTIEDYVPGDQQEKLHIIEDMGLMLGPLLEQAAGQAAPSTGEQLAAMRALLDALDVYLSTMPGSSGSPAAADLRSAVGDLLSGLQGLNVQEQEQRLIALEHSLLDTLPITLERLRTGLAAQPFAAEALPVGISARWLSPAGLYRVEVAPSADIGDSNALRRFVGAVRTVSPQATGGPVFTLEAGDAVISSFKQAFGLALLSITLLLALLLRRISDTLLVLVPLLLAAILTAATTVVSGIPFNFANIIALPLLLGIGVDSGIHLVHRARAGMPPDLHLLRTSTARAVVFSALTTVCSFGNLSFSSHRGMASMGQLLTVGVGVTLICVLLVLPALLDQHRRWSERR